MTGEMLFAILVSLFMGSVLGFLVTLSASDGFFRWLTRRGELHAATAAARLEFEREKWAAIQRDVALWKAKSDDD